MGRYDVKLRKCMDDGVTPRCKATVPNYINGWSYPHQCSRKGTEPADDGKTWYCKQHHPITVEKRKRASKDKNDKEWAVRRKQLYGTRFFEILKRIADGHNDPRALAQKEIDEFNGKG